jgi:hypothetical protein
MPKIEQIINNNPEKEITRKGFLRKHPIFILIVLVVFLSATSIYFYLKSRNNPDAVSQVEVEALIKKIGRLMILPEGDETPTVATVSDPELLKGQEFFSDAKKGDKVIIYSKAKKAILYDPLLDKIITIAPLSSASTKAPINTEGARN